MLNVVYRRGYSTRPHCDVGKHLNQDLGTVSCSMEYIVEVIELVHTMTEETVEIEDLI